MQAAVPHNYRWYNLSANKNDLSFYSKLTQELRKNLFGFIDLQYRNIKYAINGFKNNPTLLINNNYSFINPKLGLTYNKNNWQVYASYAIAQHEPNRDDFEASTTQQPKPELLNDVEIGIERKKINYSFGANLFYMKYKNQLVLTGKINDIGAYTRTNIKNSFRTGIELQGALTFFKWMNVACNIALSKNKIKNFTEFLDDYDNGGQKTNFYSSTDIAFSPGIVASGTVNFIPIKNGGISLLSKYVGRQYLDNTSKKSRSMNPYYVQDVRLSYLIKNKVIKATNLIIQLNNIFSKKYEANGYSFSYIYGGALTTENYYFPMSTFNVMAGINISF